MEKSVDQEIEDEAGRSTDGQDGGQARPERSYTSSIIVGGYYEKDGQKCHQVPKTQCHEVPVKHCQTITKYQKSHVHTSAYPKPAYGPY